MDTNANTTAEIPVGAKLQVQKNMNNETFSREGEVLAMRILPNAAIEYYVHYTNFNKRLDEWVSIDRLDMGTLQLPTGKSSHGNAGHGSHSKNPATKKAGNRTKKSGRPSLASSKAATLEQPPGSSDKMKIVSGAEDEDKLTKIQDQILIQDLQQQQPDASNTLSKEAEIESLRRGGSMTTRPEEVHRVKNINSVVIGKHKIETWYFSPYPPEFSMAESVYLCEFCLYFYDSKTRLARHREKCQLFHPPGNEIYRKDNISFFEIDGNKQREYTRNLCLLSKLFLDHKTLYYDVNPFLFYVMTQNDELGNHLVGYFSKEKESADNYNVACILTLPNHQRKGYGRLLISFSYELSKKEGKLGSPEKPLSDLGLLSYRTYWSEILLEYFFNTMDTEISIEELSSFTSMTTEDVLHTLQHLDVLRYYNGQYVIVLADRHAEFYEKSQKKKKISIDPEYLDWKPPVFSANQLRYI